MQFATGKEIGRGGFGIVFETVGSDGNRYAIKYLNPAAFQQQDHAMLVRRFEREVRYQQMVNHPNVVPVIEHSLTANPPWFAMPLAAGSLKDDLEADRTLGGTPKKPLFDILAGLEALHQKGLRHRDLKPANVLKFVQPDGSLLYSISDFGLTTPGVGQTSTLTGSNMAGGTPLYRPPECANNFRRATEQADIYSFGAILHDIFGGGVGRIPHSELTVAGPLKSIVEKCTKANTRRRYRSIAALREELFEVLDNTVIQFFSREEEDVIEILRAKEDLSDEEWDRAFNLIDDNADKGVSNRNIMRTIALSHIESLFKSSPDMFDGLGELYADFAVSESFDFDYCDVISDKADLFFNLGDLSLKAKMALAMLQLGTSHNRWRVERQFMRMVGPDCDPALAERVKMEVIARDIPFARRMRHVEISIDVTADQLHPILHELAAEAV
ncbi:serine/threonine-protein kinase [Sinorhizobium meliloti]|uniref:serine/threonine-protein kinase n=1 Tax=Rhizobium meliloti TaxID=382 RepID=UPI00244E0347|nr:serine/threonine-protein kinase [Sinorhizobium meliloti]WGI76003.1 serine/threonine-protein kinase [Sinorhizobium meliloti]